MRTQVHFAVISWVADKMWHGISFVATNDPHHGVAGIDVDFKNRLATATPVHAMVRRPIWVRDAAMIESDSACHRLLATSDSR
ncbi:MAG TPA: hypothetical protein PK992_11660 [Planctomycetaceae bacterium]|nr:hypothetical protein [Planctomycetaceae bacterium]